MALLCCAMLQLNRDDLDGRANNVNQYSIVLCTNDEYRAMLTHDMRSLIKCCETLAFLVRDAAHITPHNFTSCVHAIRTFVEASVDGGNVFYFLVNVLLSNNVQHWYSIIAYKLARTELSARGCRSGAVLICCLVFIIQLHHNASFNVRLVNYMMYCKDSALIS